MCSWPRGWRRCNTYDELLANQVINDTHNEDHDHDHVSSEEVGVEAGVKDTSSGGMNGVFMVVSAIAAVGIAVVSGDVLAL